jgi:hypothetical protein
MIKENFKYDYITFIEHENHDEYAIAVNKEFQNRGKSILLIIDSSKLASKLKQKGFFDYVCPEDYIKNLKYEIKDIYAELLRLSEVFQFRQFRQAIFPEQYFYEEPENKFYKRLCLYLKFYEDEFLNKNISCKYLIQYVGDFIPYYSRKISARMFADYVLYCGGYFIFDRYNLTGDFHGRWMIENYDISPTEKEINEINNWINNTKSNKTSVLRDTRQDLKPKINYKGFSKTLKSILKSIKDEDESGSSLRFKFKQKLLPKINYYKSSGLYKTIDLKSEKYFYFPLHVTYDSSLTSMAEPYVNQFYLIELVHRLLPYGYKLFIKEHPAALGTTPYKYLKQISKLKDVVILPISYNSHEIISYASVIIVINSTVGVEALYYEKPVITFGNNFYTGQGVTIDIRDLHETAEKINFALNFKPDKERIMEMFCRVYRDSYPVNQLELMRSFNNDTINDTYTSSVSEQISAAIDYCENRLPNLKYRKYLFDA